jgi:hypothetical protein
MDPQKGRLELSKPPTADEIAELADRGEDISRFFTNAGKMMPPIQPEERCAQLRAVGEEGNGQED